MDLDLDLRAHRTPGVEHDGVPDDSAYRPAIWAGRGEWEQGRAMCGRIGACVSRGV